jgi:hypothetical protein
MTKQVINTGTNPNDGTGDTLLSAMQKINANFTDLYTTNYSTNVVNTFNNRSGAVNLLSADVTGALGYTPINKAGDTFTGLVVMNNGFVSGQSGVFDSNLVGVGSLPGAPAGTMIRAINLDTNQSILTMDSFVNAGGTMSAIALRGSRGIGSAPTAIQTSDIVGQISAYGYGTTQFNASSSGQINFVSEGGFTNASTPTAIAFQVTASGSNTPSEQMRLTSAGNLILDSSGAIQIPVGNTGQQPSPASQGMIRFNTTTSRFENYNGIGWINHVKLAGDTMTGTLTAPALVGTTGAATLDSFVIGSITPEAATVTNLTATGTLTGFSGRLLNVQVFSTPGTPTYTATAGTNKIVVEVQGGGAAGGGTPATSASSSSVGGGGGAGTYAKCLITSGFSGTTVTVAASAAGVSGAAGTAGNTSSFGTFVSCPGGTAGLVGANLTTVQLVGTGALATAATISGGVATTITTFRGGIGSMAMVVLANTATGSSSGGGATSLFGSGGSTVASTTTGIAASGYGAGGSGASALASQSAQTGGAGGQGIVIVYEYS